MPRFNEMKDLEELPRWRLFILVLVLLAFILSGVTVRWANDVVLPRIYKGAPTGAERLRVINNDGTLSNGDKLTKSQNIKFGTIEGAVWVIACAATSLLILRLWPAPRSKDDVHSAPGTHQLP
jgi:hypothetical protein